MTIVSIQVNLVLLKKDMYPKQPKPRYHAKKSFGQNFLKDKEVLGQIIQKSGINQEDLVLEIGPGPGFLTEKLLEVAKEVVAVEVDRDLVKVLENKFREVENFTLINEDILKFKPDFSSYKIVANIPYNITGRILRYFLEEVENKPKSMTLMVQKEVAAKIVEKEPNHNLLSLSVQVFANPTLVLDVNRDFFNPVPDVDSAVLHIELLQKPLIKDTKLFFELIRKAFQGKRKILKNTLQLEPDVFLKAKIEPTKRPEDLSISDWNNLIESL